MVSGTNSPSWPGTRRDADAHPIRPNRSGCPSTRTVWPVSSTRSASSVPHVLGLSWGSTLALELFRRSPTVPRTLVLTGGYAGWAGSLSPNEVAERLERFMTQFEEPPERWVRDYIPTLLTERASSEMAEELVALMAESRPAGLRAMILAMAEADLRDVLPKIDVPTLLLYGEEDVRSPLSVAEELHAQIPDSTLVVMPGVGHQSQRRGGRSFQRRGADLPSIAVVPVRD